MSAEMDAAVAAMDAAVTKTVGDEDSAIVLIHAIAAKILEFKNEPARLTAYANTLTSKADELAAAVAENPAEPPVTPTEG